MIPNHTPTELEIEMQATMMFPDSKPQQACFIEGVYHTIYHMKSSK